MYKNVSIKKNLHQYKEQRFGICWMILMRDEKA